MQEPVAQRCSKRSCAGSSTSCCMCTLYAACRMLYIACCFATGWPLQLEKLREQLNELHRQVDGASTSMTEDSIQR